MRDCTQQREHPPPLRPVNTHTHHQLERSPPCCADSSSRKFLRDVLFVFCFFVFMKEARHRFFFLPIFFVSLSRQRSRPSATWEKKRARRERKKHSECMARRRHEPPFTHTEEQQKRRTQIVRGPLVGVSRRRSSPTFSRKFASASQPIQLEDGQEFSTQKLSGQRDDDNGDDFLGSISTRSVFQFFFQYFPENFTVFSYRKKPIKYRNFGKIPKKPEKTALAEVDPHKYTKTKIKMGLFLVDNSNGATRTPHPATLRLVTAPLR